MFTFQIVLINIVFTQCPHAVRPPLRLPIRRPAVTIENGVESIGDQAFFDTDISEITIPSSVKTMGYAVFGKNLQITMVHCMFLSLPSGRDPDRFSGGAHGSPDIPYEWIAEAAP